MKFDVQTGKLNNPLIKPIRKILKNIFHKYTGSNFRFFFYGVYYFLRKIGIITLAELNSFLSLN